MTARRGRRRPWGGRVVRLLRDRENQVLEMELPKGTAALRLHRQGYQSPEAITSELWWCAELARAGLPVPARCPALDGNLLVQLADGRHASAIAWIEGEALGEAEARFTRPMREVLDIYHGLGALLARLHRATDALTLPRRLHAPALGPRGAGGRGTVLGPVLGASSRHP